MSKSEVIPQGASALVTQQAVKDLKSQRDLMAKFVRSQLKEADFSNPKSPSYGEGDYGIIPGTKKRCLFKPGAEKILGLFGLGKTIGVRFRIADKEFDLATNFALYTYRCEIYLLASNHVIAECEATANSQEVKYKERTEWSTNSRGGRESSKVETPICDVVNTLQKMAQKRALIGATLLATGASEYFTQDILDADEIIPEQEPRDVTPKTSSKTSKEDAPIEAKSETPACCGKAMMLSKYVDKDLGHRPWFCMQCRAKVPAELVAS